MVYKSMNGLAHGYLSSKLKNSEGKLAVPLPRTNYYKNSFSYSDADLWNSLSSDVKQDTVESLVTRN